MPNIRILDSNQEESRLLKQQKNYENNDYDDDRPRQIAINISDQHSIPTKKSMEWKKFMKYVSLCVLVVQTSSIALILRYSRTVNRDKSMVYISSTAVFFTEVVKFTVSLTVLIFKAGFSLRGIRSVIIDEVFGSAPEMLKMMVPAGLYAIQNNFLFIALSNLDSVTFQVLNQTKIVTTAFFAWLLLKKKLSALQIFSLLVLMGGVATIQIAPKTHKVDIERVATNQNYNKVDVRLPPSTTPFTLTTNTTLDDSTTSIDNKGIGTSSTSAKNNIYARPVTATASKPAHYDSKFIGFLVIILASLSSGFASCFFEKTMKSPKASMWVRNVQLSLFSGYFAYVLVCLESSTAIERDGFFQGYNKWVWIVVFNQAIGGLCVAFALKYADSILKSFATSLSIIVSSIISKIWFDFYPSPMFIIGSSLVIGAVFMYSSR